MNAKRFRRTAVVLALAPLAAAACAGGPPSGQGARPEGREGGPGGGRFMASPLFISPFGEPFQGQPGAPWPVAEWFSGADLDSDGFLTFAEFEADGLRWFAHLDRSGDGRINPSELSDYETSLAALRGSGRRGFPGGESDGPSPRAGDDSPRLDVGARAATQSGPPGGGQQAPRGRRGDGPRSYGLIAEAGFFNLPQPVRTADANLDQTITAEEWGQATQRWFMSLDADRDGRLTLETLPQTPLQQRAAQRQDRRGQEGEAGLRRPPRPD